MVNSAQGEPAMIKNRASRGDEDIISRRADELGVNTATDIVGRAVRTSQQRSGDPLPEFDRGSAQVFINFNAP